MGEVLRLDCLLVLVSARSVLVVLCLLDAEVFRNTKDSATKNLFLLPTAMYSNHDLIMSADALDVGNTGFLIIRNTDWTRRFFATWWLQRGSKFTFCDQHVLNKLYHEKIEWRQRIKILPSHELNSIWPAMENLRSDHRILHLMGELNVYRDAVFENISRTTCAALASEYIPRLENKINWGLLPHQLGVTREVSTHCLFHYLFSFLCFDFACIHLIHSAIHQSIQYFSQ